MDDECPSASVFPWYTFPSSPSDNVVDLPLPYYDLDDDDGSVLEPIVDIVSDPVLYSDSYSMDPTSHYLYALDLCLQETQSNCSTFYTETVVFSPGPLLLAHMDAGSMANTTNRSDYLWDFKLLHSSATTLRVADDTPYHPTGIGFLKVPTLGLPSFLLIHTFYTPSLPATILSPASITSDAGYIGYTSFARLDGQDCYLTLHGSPPTSEEIVFPLQFGHGLLFTHALIAPSAAHSSASLRQVSCQESSSYPLLFLFNILLSNSYLICGISILGISIGVPLLICIALLSVSPKFPYLTTLISVLSVWLLRFTMPCKVMRILDMPLNAIKAC